LAHKTKFTFKLKKEAEREQTMAEYMIKFSEDAEKVYGNSQKL
jgi:hypothetical protein